MRSQITLVLMTLVFAGLLGVGGYVGYTIAQHGQAAPPNVVIRSTGLQIEQVRRLSALTTLRVPITEEETAELSGYTGGTKVVLTVKGDVDLATDLDKACFAERNEASKTAVLLLPPPRAMRPRIDHEGTRVVHVSRSGVWSVMPGSAGETAATDIAMKQAQRHIEQVASRPDLVGQAMQHTQSVLQPFFEALGWRVTIRWDPTLRTAEG